MQSGRIGAYRKINVETADPRRLVIMCYDAAIFNLKIVKVKYEKKDYEGKAVALQKAAGLINELLCSLDLERGGQIARNLKTLYSYMSRRLIEADIRKDVSAIDELIHMLEELGGAWREVFFGTRTAGDTSPVPGLGRGVERQAAAAYA